MGSPKCRAMTNETIDPGFYILTAISAGVALAFVVSHWFA